MAIKISGTTVIDNSRNICNAVNGNFSGDLFARNGSFTGNVCATCFVGNGSGLTNMPTDPKVFFISARR
jgi:hypothetical protein